MARISEVQINLIKPKDGLIGFASLVVDDALFLGSIGIHQKLSGIGYRLTYPNRKAGNRSFDFFHPINSDVAARIEKAVFEKLENVMSRCNDGHSGFNAGKQSV